MIATRNRTRVLITGGATMLGLNLAAALLAEGAEVTLLVRPGAEGRLGPLAQRTRWYPVDVWDPASLRGRARGHGTVIHTVGSMTADPARGLTYHRLNVVSARNAANMCISDGVSHLMLLSAARAPWIDRRYIHAKREAEAYLTRVGLQVSIIRAPLTFVRGQPRPLFYRLLTFIGGIPPLSWTPLTRVTPLPIDVLSRGIARIALNEQHNKTIYYAADLRRRNRREELKGVSTSMRQFDMDPEDTRQPFELLDEDTPFGWMPPDPQGDSHEP